MSEAQRRPAFTLIELLVVMALIVVIFALGAGYIVFGRDGEKTVLGVQTVSGAILNAKGRARRDGRPTGIRVLFGTNGLPPPQANQLQFIQQPEDYNSGICNGGTNTKSLTFSNGVDPNGNAIAVDFVGGGEPLSPTWAGWTVQPGDYFLVAGVQTPHLIKGVGASPPSISLASPATLSPGTAYNIIRAPRPIPSEDLISLPAGFVIDKNGCKGLPPAANVQDGDLVFAPSGGVIGQNMGEPKVILWICAATTPAPLTSGGPLLVSVQVRTGTVGAYPVLPGPNLYFYANDPRASGI